MDKTLTLGSLFSGAGTFELAGFECGIEPVWASEVEPFPIAVTKKHFPNLLHLGDINKINGAAIPHVDIITGGFCCQDLSLANGKRQGLLGHRSGLFIQMIRITREMLAATDGAFPKALIFENVEGLLSSSKGQDIKTVMDEISALGFISDANVLNAADHGVAQRRRRVFIVAINHKHFNPNYFANAPKSTRTKRMEKAMTAWGGETFYGIASRPHEPVKQRLSEILQNDVDDKYYLSQRACLGILRRAAARGKELPDVLRIALETQAGLVPCETAVESEPICFEGGALSRRGGHHWRNLAGTLRATPGDNHQSVVYDSRGNGDGHTVCSIVGDHNGRVTDYTALAVEAKAVTAYGISSYASQAMLSDNPKAGIYEAETARTLDCSACNPSQHHGGIAVVEDIPYTMTCGCYTQVCKDAAPTIMARDFKQGPIVARKHYVARRLTPQECALLMGTELDYCANLGISEPTEDDIAFWTRVFEEHRLILGKSKRHKTRKQIIKWLQNPHSDSAEYKLWGNSCVRQCLVFLLSGLVDYFEAQKHILHF